MDIDLVYLWVNGNDPKWIAKRDACIGKPSGKQENCAGRYADSGELKYSLRSIEKYAPWIRKVFIVTDEQTPEWLDTSNPKVHVVDHKEIMPKESLPCFNSNLIEHFLDKIPGLSEHFLFANDDMYINRPVSPATFFEADGLPILYVNRKPFRKLALYLRERLIGKPMSMYQLFVRNASELVEKHYGKYYGCKLHHNIDAYLKSTITYTNEKFATDFEPMLQKHVRSTEDIQRVVYTYVAMAEKRGHRNFVSHKHSFRLHIDNRRLYEKFERYNPLFFCMNDSEYANDADRENAIQFLERLFPKKSKFEK